MAHEMNMGNDNILRIKFIGNFDAANVQAYVEEAAPFLETATESQPIHFLVDVSQMGKAFAGARKAFGEIFRDPDPRTGYTALVGANRYLRVATGFILRATGNDTLRMFDTEKEGLAWLKSLDTAQAPMPTSKEVSP